jgi:TolA-binding protein
MRTRKAQVGLWLAGVTLAAGCVTKGEGEKIWAEIRALQAQNSEILRSLNENRTKLVSLMQSADQKAENLNKKIEQAESVLRRTNVDFFQQLQQMQTETSKNSGRIEQLERNLEVFKRDLDAFREEAAKKLAQATTKPVPPEQTLPADPQVAYEAAARALAAGQPAKAVELFLAILKQFPKHPRLEDIQFNLAEAYYAKGDFKHALAEYSRYYQDFGSSERAAEALFKVAKCYEELGDYRTAVLSLKVITKKFKKSSFAKEARRLMKLLQKKI